MAAMTALFGFASAFSPVTVFGTLIPKDGGVSVVSDIAYGEADRQRLDIYRPQGETSGLPVIFFTYGGGWDSGGKADYAFVGKAFASRGYVTVVADYRLVPEVVYPEFLNDNAAALGWVQNNIATYGGDASNLFLMGHSAGAYNVMMLTLDGAYGVDPQSIKGVIGLSGPYDFYPFDVSASINAFGHVAEPESTQPINLARENTPPTLLLHGGGDDTVLPRNSIALAQALTAAGALVELKLYEGASHADTLISLSMPLRWRYPVFDDVLAFLARHGGVGS